MYIQTGAKESQFKDFGVFVVNELIEICSVPWYFGQWFIAIIP